MISDEISLENWVYSVNSWNIMWFIISECNFFLLFMFCFIRWQAPWANKTRVPVSLGTRAHCACKQCSINVREKKEEEESWYALYKEFTEMTSDFEIFQLLLNDFHLLDWSDSLMSSLLPLWLITSLIRITFSGNPALTPQTLLHWHALTVPDSSPYLRKIAYWILYI